MSLKTWKEEFYPVEAETLKSATDKECLEHALKKWSGVRKDNLNKHKIAHMRGKVGGPEENLFLNRDTCALCAKHYTGSTLDPCGKCPLVDCTYVVQCAFIFHDIRPMLLKLRKCLREI